MVPTTVRQARPPRDRSRCVGRRPGETMKAGIHPEYQKALITCACGRVTETRSTVGELHVEICSHCHPFFTGRQKLVDTAGRVERFMAKYGMEEGEAETGEEVGAAEDLRGGSTEAEQAAAHAVSGEAAAEQEQVEPAAPEVEAIEGAAESDPHAETDEVGEPEASEPGINDAEEVDEETGAPIDA